MLKKRVSTPLISIKNGGFYPQKNLMLCAFVVWHLYLPKKNGGGRGIRTLARAYALLQV